MITKNKGTYDAEEVRYSIRKKWKPELERNHPQFFTKRFYRPEEALRIIQDIEEKVDDIAERYSREFEKEVPIMKFLEDQEDYNIELKLNNINELLTYESREMDINVSFDYKVTEQNTRFGRSYNRIIEPGRKKIQVEMEALTDFVSDEEFEEYDRALREMGFR